MLAKRRLIVIPLAVSLAIVAIAVLIFRFVAAQESGPRPELPAGLLHLRSEWNLPIELPAYLPDCLGYDAIAGNVAPEPDARAGQALKLRFSARDTSECEDFDTANIEIMQALALHSLEGRVTTVSFDRLQFARTQQPAGSGGERVTFQWRCEGLMCRLSATASDTVTEDVLLRIARSVQRTR